MEDRTFPEWLGASGWRVLKVCTIGHCRYTSPEWEVCRLDACGRPSRRLLPSELSMFMIGEERAVMSYYAEELP